ncbi:MAG: GGDEF domain-containing protein, partial [Lachnospiraceae bacterium]|nr:GGDEF domain-containing protein [Lachnospiraceae bacterium]
MNSSLLQKAIDYINKDTSEQNESPKLIVVIRILVLSMLFYMIINSIIYISILNNIGIGILLVSFLIYLAIFFMSYHVRTSKVVYTLALCTSAWIIVNIAYFGWDVGVQHFIIVMLILSFFSGYSQYAFKASSAAVLCCFRIYLFFLCKSREPSVSLPPTMVNLLQIINTIMIFWCISIIAYMFSKDSQTLEGKLIDYNNQLQDQANTDALTGLYNRRKAMQYLEEILVPSNHSFTSICICDIDFFKKVNDNYGHDVGDIVLQNLADIMTTTLEKNILAARWGGEEFLLVFSGYNGDEAYAELESLRNNIKALEFKAKEKTFSITMTFGLAEYDFSSDIDTVIKEADE